MRKNNLEDMTVIEQIENIKEKICDDYCKYREDAFSKNKDTDKAEDYLLDYCDNCPVRRL